MRLFKCQPIANHPLLAMQIPTGVSTLQLARVWLILAAILLLALGLRVYRIDGQSLWYDEGTSVALAGRDLASITRDAAADIHPPFYYYLLHAWVRLFGSGEVAVRSLSAIIGVSVVILTFQLGQRLFGLATGLLAALLSALSPFQVYYSQETRMYILVTALGAASMLALLRWLDDGGAEGIPGEAARRQPSLASLSAWVLSMILALYTHYFAVSLLLVANLVFGAWLLFSTWRLPGTRFRIRAWLIAQGLVVIAYLPWLRLTWQQVQTWPAVSAPFTATFLAGEVLRVFPLGLSVERTMTIAIALLGAMLAIGLLPGQKRCILNWSISWLYLVIPVAALYLLSLRRPLYNPKFLLLATPAYFLLLARGVLTLARGIDGMLQKSIFPRQMGCFGVILAALLTLFVAIPEVQSLSNYYFDPRYARDDYRGIAHYVAATGRAGDAIILNAPAQVEIFRYYYRGNLEIYPLPRRRPPDPSATRQAVADIVAGHRRIFAILWATDQSDPDRLVEGELERTTYQALDTWWGNLRLALYATPTRVVTATHAARVNLAGQVTLTGYDLGTSSVAPGDILPVTLFWQATAPISQPLKVFIHLLDAQGNILAQRDGEPGGGNQPRIEWPTGDRVVDRQGVLIPLGTPPVAAQVVAGLYRADTGQRLAIVASDQAGDADRIFLGQVQIERPAVAPPVETLAMQHRTQVSFGPVRLLGYNQHRLGFDHAPDTPLAPGEQLHLVLYWQALVSKPAFAIHAQLEDSAGHALAGYDLTPTGGTYSPDRWVEGEVIRDQHRLPLPTHLVPGEYRVRLSLVDTDGTKLGSSLVLAPFRVE